MHGNISQQEQLDPFDPNTWDLEDRTYRMYAGTLAQHECEVDEEDYHYFTRWLWVSKHDKYGKIYFRRAVSTYDMLGKRLSSATVYLHIEILTRAEGPAPTVRRRIADHLDGNALNNKRSNLRWATVRENNRNRFGSAFYQRRFF